VWERETMLAAESAVTAAEEGCSKGELVGLKRAWPPSRQWPRQNRGVRGGRGSDKRESRHRQCCREGGSLRLG